MIFRLPRDLRRRLITTIVGVMAASTVLAGPALAAQPHQTQFAYTNSFVDPDTCAADGLVLDVVERVRGIYLEWDAPDGTFERATVSVDIEFEIAGSNGVTLFEKDHVVRQFTTDGYREVGLWEHVRGPNGVVVIDAGQLVFDNDGNVLFEPGQHDFFHGLSSFCPGFFE
jgi:hypothetical protein